MNSFYMFIYTSDVNTTIKEKKLLSGHHPIEKEDFSLYALHLEGIYIVSIHVT